MPDEYHIYDPDPQPQAPADRPTEDTFSGTGDWMQTYSGGKFWPLDPRPEHIHLEDIAHALSFVNRFAGHTNRPYSVAQHSVILARHFRGSPPMALWALFHDAPEAYIGDMVRPLKRHIPQFQEIEDRIMTAVATRFGLIGRQVPDAVKMADTQIINDERYHLLKATGETWNTEKFGCLGLPDGRLDVWDARHAEVIFHSTYAQLMNEQR